MTQKPETVTRWRVWIHIEAQEQLPNGETWDVVSDEIDLPFASTGPAFDTEAEAVAFATRLHMIGENTR